MRIGLNLLFLKPQLAGGTETYSYGLLKGLANISSQTDEYYIFCSYNLKLDFLEGKSNFHIIKINLGTSIAYRCFYEQFVFPLKLKKYKLNILHSLGYIGPVVEKNHIVTIHDTNAFAHEDMRIVRKIFLSRLMSLTAKFCTHIITVSSFSKKEIIKHLNVQASKISVIYEACKYLPSTQKKTLPSSFAFLNTGKYFVALGSVTKNKNIDTLIAAFKIVLQTYTDVKLVLAGHLPPDNSIQQTIETSNLKDKIIITGYITEEELIALFQQSISFVFPSLYEGFGLPLLEAQNLGVPVISSDKASLPEVAKQSVLYFDGKDIDELAKKMTDMYLHENTRTHFIDAGYENAKRFSWINTAEQVAALYKQFSNHYN